jgi:hypothetical protein
MKKQFGFLVVAGLVATFSAQAIPTVTTNVYNFSASGVTDSDFLLSGTIEATSNGDGSYTAISASGSFDSSSPKFANDTFTLTPNPNAPGTVTLATDWAIDNQLFSEGGLATTNGINFNFTDSGTDYYLAIWQTADSSGAYYASIVQQDGTYLTSTSDFLNGNGEISTFTVTPTPEPTSLALAGLGIAGFIAARRRK